MVAEHHVERRELNRRARTLLTADGTLHGPALNAAGTLFQAGDEVIARRPDSCCARQEATVTATCATAPAAACWASTLTARTVTVDFERRGPIEVPWSYLTAPIRPGVTGGLAHSYALTSHAAQGETYRAGRHLASDRSTRKAVYVGLTRGQSDVRLYTVRHRELHPEPVDDDLPRIADNTPTLEAITGRLVAGGDEHLARELDPTAAALPRPWPACRSPNLWNVPAWIRWRPPPCVSRRGGPVTGRSSTLLRRWLIASASGPPVGDPAVRGMPPCGPTPSSERGSPAPDPDRGRTSWLWPRSASSRRSTPATSSSCSTRRSVRRGARRSTRPSTTASQDRG